MPRPPSSPDADPPASPARPGRLQMADLARIAGVSVATVSRALNGSTEVSAATRQRITELARSLNYTINVSAKNLRLRHNRTVAVVIPYDRQTRLHVSDPFFLSMLGSLADALTDRGHDMLVSRIDADQLETASQSYDSGTALGIIMIGQWHSHEQLNRLADQGVPLVVWGAQLPQQRYCSVGGDNLGGGRLATRHLLGRGCRRFVFLGDPTTPESEQRLRGHRQELAEAGLPPEATRVLPVGFDADRARAQMHALLESGAPIDAVFACSDMLATAVVPVLRLHGREVPRDVAVVGYDDIAWASHADPPLTTVRQPVARAGVEMVDALFERVAGRAAPSRTLPVELVVRQSSMR
ncbi:MAG: hypothetical protein QG612_450 [Pseudomonadota bacterium]|nr:hypothetical protein [Pseudomonadota bacterium]